MASAVFFSLSRGAMLLLLYGAIAACCHRIIGADAMPHKRRQLAIRIQGALLAILILAWLLECGVSLSRAAGHAQAHWAGRLLWPCAAAVVAWLVLLAMLGGCALYFRVEHWPKYKRLQREVASLGGDTGQRPTADELRRLEAETERLKDVFPCGTGRLCERLSKRLRPMIRQAGPSELLQHASALLKQGQPQRGLRRLLRHSEMATEALLLALDTASWREAAAILSGVADRGLRIEAAEILAERADAEQCRQVGLDMLSRELGERRHAAFELRTGDPDRARALISDDHEAMAWLANEQNPARTGDESRR